MAMTMQGVVDLAAPQTVVWDKLNDPAVLQACIPGCQSLEKVSETAFVAVARNKIGPVTATFRGKVDLSDLDPPNAYRIHGEGDGGVAGFAKGAARVALAPDGAGTKLTYVVEAQVGGKIAQLGARLVDGVAKKLADQFFANFAAVVSDPPAATGESPDDEAPPQHSAEPSDDKKGVFGRLFGAKS